MDNDNRSTSFLSGFFNTCRNKLRRFSKWCVSLFDFGKQAWKEHVPMTKAKAERMLKRGLPRGTKVSVKVDSDGQGRLELDASYISEVTKSFDLDKKVAYSGYMELAKTGKGIGRKIMRNQIEFFIASGCEKLEMHAGLNAGGYTWARLGFLPYDKGEYKDDFRELRQEVRERYKKVAPLLSDSEKERMDEILKFKDAKAVWKLADSRIDLGKRLRDVFKAAANDDRKAQRLEEKLSPLVDSDDLKGDKPQPIGRILLAGTSWHGEMDFKDKAQMKRVSDYVGGLEAKPPAPH
ncbi:MAG: hypothetical protein ACAH80_06575 [Alphaproteobacteria bacterium]